MIPHCLQNKKIEWLAQYKKSINDIEAFITHNTKPVLVTLIAAECLGIISSSKSVLHVFAPVSSLYFPSLSDLAQVFSLENL